MRAYLSALLVLAASPVLAQGASSQPASPAQSGALIPALPLPGPKKETLKSPLQTSRSSFCGDGFLDPGEACDEGQDNSDTEPDACRTDCQTSSCGDGVLDLAEECDAGADNSFSPDACRVDCRKPVCGDEIVDADETCDDGNLFDGDECHSDCRATPGLTLMMILFAEDPRVAAALGLFDVARHLAHHVSSEPPKRRPRKGRE